MYGKKSVKSARVIMSKNVDLGKGGRDINAKSAGVYLEEKRREKEIG